MADNCGLLDVACGVSNLASGELGKFAADLMSGANDLWNGFFTSWVTSGIDGIAGGATANWFAGIALPIEVILLALGLMVAGIRTALAARGGPAADAGKRFLRAILITAGGVTFFGVMQVGSIALAKWILDTASSGATPKLLDAATFTSNVAMALVFGLLALIATAIQWIIMILRAVALSVLLPFWPVTAAGAMFESQQQMFEKATGWLMALLFYSPVAAAIYGLAIKFRTGKDGVEGLMIGLAVFILAIFALPALMRLVVPMSSALGRASAGALAFGALRTATTAGVAAGSAVATSGASVPVSAASAGGGAAATPAAAPGSTGSAGATGSAGSTGGTGGTGDAGGSGQAGGSGASGSSGSSTSSGRSAWDSVRDLGNAMPTGSRGVGEMIDE